VHPECLPAVAAKADYIGSTTGIMDYAKNSDKKEFVIGTENSIVEHLQYECPDKKFYPLSKDCVCHNMKLTTLTDVLNCVKGQGGKEIILSDEVISKAKNSINKMIELG
jgi:quinolinate synthase